MTVLQHICATVVICACALLFVGLVGAAAIGTSVALGLSAGWSLIVLAAYGVIAIGAIDGAIECWGE